MVFTAKCTHWDTYKITNGIKKCNLCNMLILTNFGIKRKVTIDYEM